MENLGKTYFFKDFDAAELDTLQSMTRIREVPKGDTVLVQARVSEELFIVRTGSVRVLLTVPEGMEGPTQAEQTLVVLGPGECFGEFAFIDGLPSSASVEAAEASTVYAIPHAVLDRLVKQNPATAVKIYRALLHVLVSRIRNTDIELAMRKALG